MYTYLEQFLLEDNSEPIEQLPHNKQQRLYREVWGTVRVLWKLREQLGIRGITEHYCLFLLHMANGQEF